jgi:hypothetical protein
MLLVCLPTFFNYKVSLKFILRRGKFYPKLYLGKDYDLMQSLFKVFLDYQILNSEEEQQG